MDQWEWFLNPVELNEEETQLLEGCRQSGGARQLVDLLPDDQLEKFLSAWVNGYIAI